MKWLGKLRGRSVPPSLQQMVMYLLDKSGDLGTRDDIAMDLGASDDPEAEAALIQIATDFSDEEMVIDSAGESLWQIWSRQGKKPPEAVLAKMHPSAQKFFSNQ